MTDLRPIFVPTIEGAEAVVREARRRRRLQATAAAGAAAAVILGTAASLAFGGPSPAADRLNTVNGGPSPSPSPSAAVAPTAATATSAHVGVTVAPRPGGPAATVVAPHSAGTAVAAPPVTSVRQVDRSPITRGSGTIAPDDLCTDNSGYSAFGWCVRYVGPSTVRRGQVTTLSGELCRLASYPAASVTFSTTREVDLSVLDSHANREWQAGQGIRYQSPGRTVTVSGGSCIVWSSPWNTRGPDGLLVPPGDYSASIGIDSSDTNFPSVGTGIQVVD